MANGFLSPEGIFEECDKNGHRYVAEDLLSKRHEWREYAYKDKSFSDTLCELDGYMYFKEHYGSFYTRYEDFDGVYIDEKHTLTEKQCKWINEHFSELSERQKQLINKYLSDNLKG